MYVYEFQSSADGETVEWVRRLIDYGSRSGGGVQTGVADLDRDTGLGFALGDPWPGWLV